MDFWRKVGVMGEDWRVSLRLSPDAEAPGDYLLRVCAMDGRVPIGDPAIGS